MIKVDNFFKLAEKVNIRKTVYLIEDCFAKQAEVTEICLGLNVELKCFTNAYDALELTLHTPPSLLIVDWKLPGSMTGLEFITKVRQAGVSQPILFFTNFSSPTIHLQSLQNNATVYFDKSQPTELFIAQIESLLFTSDAGTDMDEISPEELSFELSNQDFQTLLVFHIAVDAQLTESFDIPSLCNSVNVSEKKIRATIKEHFDLTLQDYIVSFKLFKSLILLKQKLPIKQISNSFNYANSANYSNAFKRKYGVAPAEYFAAHQV